MFDSIKKNLKGNEPVPDDCNDEEVYIQLTVSEYNELHQVNQKYQKAEEENQRLAKEISHLEQAEKQANQRASEQEKNRREAEAQLADAQTQLTNAQEEIAHQKGLNDHLLRISKERANAERKLTPKKGHTGYAVLLSTEKLQYNKSPGSTQKSTLTTWETFVQTPHPVDLPEEQTRRLVQDALCLLQKLGITEDGTAAFQKQEFLQVRNKYKDKENVLLEWTLRANFKAGYWELRLLHTQPLGIVPDDMRLPTRKPDKT